MRLQVFPKQQFLFLYSLFANFQLSCLLQLDGQVHALYQSEMQNKFYNIIFIFQSSLQ